MSRYDIVCIHTTGGSRAPAHAAHFSTRADGKIYQSRDTKFRSAANLQGNPRVIAIENEDVGPAFAEWDRDDGHAVPAFTAGQLEAIAKICAWVHQTHGVPLVPCPNSKPGSKGIAYHRQGIDGNWQGYEFRGRVRGGEVWTESRGKVCPGDRRIAQIPRIIARAREIVEGDMQLTDKVKLKPWQRKYFDDAAEVTVATLLADAAAQGRRNKQQLDALRKLVEELARLQAEPMSDPDREMLAAAVAAKVAHLEQELRVEEEAVEGLPRRRSATR